MDRSAAGRGEDRRLPLLVFLVAAVAATALHAGPAGGAPAAPYDVQVRTHIVPTRHGGIYTEVAVPVDGDGDVVTAPVILTYSPYSVLGRDGGRQRWVPRGYAVAFADVVGTGNSGGCYDYGGRREKQTGHDLVEWLAEQPWSTGKVAMIGGSYNGTTANATAVTRPPHLVTIVPEAAISRWYGYAYEGGIRYLLNNEHPADEGADTPLLFDFGFAIPPPLDYESDDWAPRVESTVRPCDEVAHTTHGYDDTPDYDAFWRERDYLRDAGKVRIPVLVAHNWGDYNVKQSEGWNWFHALRRSPHRVLFMGDRYSGHGRPGGDYDKTVDAWFDHYLKGRRNGVDRLPAYVTQTADYDGPGRFRAADRVDATTVSLTAQHTPQTNPSDYEWKLLPDEPRITPLSTVARFPASGINTESHANHHARMRHDWFWFETPALKRDVRIFGSPEIRIRSRTNREWVTFTPTLVDIDPGCHQTVANQHVSDPTCAPRNLYSVTRGWLDTRYRDGLAEPKPLQPNRPFGVTVVTKPTDYVFKAGHMIGLQVATEINEWSVPKVYPCASTATDCVQVDLLWEDGRFGIDLPVVDAPTDPDDLFTYGHGGHG